MDHSHARLPLFSVAEAALLLLSIGIHIDIDFAHDVKDDVVELIFEKYGRDQCAVVGGFSTFQARSAFAEVAKVLGVSERDVRKFTEHFPWGFGGGWVPDDSLLKEVRV